MRHPAPVEELVGALDEWRKAAPQGWDDTMEIGAVLHAEYCRDTVRHLLASLLGEARAAPILRRVMGVLNAEDFDAYEPASVFRAAAEIDALVPVEFWPQEEKL